MKSDIKSKIFIAFIIIVITSMLYLTIYSRGELHDFYRRLYYIPIILSAFKFRLRGAIIAVITIIVLYVPHLTLYFRVIGTNIVNQVLEIIMFIVVACITGTLVEKEFKVKKLEEQIRRTEKLSAIGELAAGIAHEIRNPLAIIKTIAQTIDKDIEDEETKEGLEIIEDEIDRANRVIQGLLDFARPNVLKNEVQCLSKIIDIVTTITNKYAEQHRVRISFHCESDVTSSVDGDKLKQAFINIILNSVQAMPGGGNIYINLYRKGEWNVISFKDEGIGIGRDKLEKVFEPFYTTKEKGTGLGLSITHRVIEEHKGYVKIESEEKKGTQIDIYLPFAKSE